MSSVRGAIVVIGVGSAFRRDDGVGPAAAGLLWYELPDVDVVELDGEPARLLDAWAQRDLAVVVDAVRAGASPGSIHRVEVGVDPVPGGAQPASSHGAGVAEAIALGTALDRLPGRLVVYGIEPADVGAGTGLSPAVERAVPALLELVVEEVRGCA